MPRVLLLGGDGGHSGVPRHLEQLCETLRETAALTVLSDRNRGGYDRIRAMGVRHVEVDGLRSCLRPGPLWRGWRGVLRVLRGQTWDVIWLHAPLPALTVRLMLALRLFRPPPGVRIVLSYHSLLFGPGHRPHRAMIARALERFLLARCPPMHLVSLSPDMAARLRHAVGAARLARHRLHTLPNSSDIGALPATCSARSDRRLVITGRAGYQKNYRLAVRLMDHMPGNYSLTLCGAGTDAPGFQARMLRQVDTRTRARIHFAGPLADVRPVLAQADGYLLTSRYEGLPIGAIEAFECGLPVILGPVDSAPGLVAAHPAALCLPLRDLSGDAVRIVQLIERHIGNRTASTARIRAAWRRTYSYDAWQQRARRLLRDVLAG